MSNADIARRDTVIDEIRRLLDRLDRTNDSVGLPPIEALAGASDMQRLEQIEGLLRTLRGALMETGEVSSTLLIAAAAQLVAWCAAQDERSECKVVTS